MLQHSQNACNAQLVSIAEILVSQHPVVYVRKDTFAVQVSLRQLRLQMSVHLALNVQLAQSLQGNARQESSHQALEQLLAQLVLPLFSAQRAVQRQLVHLDTFVRVEMPRLLVVLALTSLEQEQADRKIVWHVLQATHATALLRLSQLYLAELAMLVSVELLQQDLLTLKAEEVCANLASTVLLAQEQVLFVSLVATAKTLLRERRLVDAKRATTALLVPQSPTRSLAQRVSTALKGQQLQNHVALERFQRASELPPHPHAFPVLLVLHVSRKDLLVLTHHPTRRWQGAAQLGSTAMKAQPPIT